MGSPFLPVTEAAARLTRSDGSDWAWSGYIANINRIRHAAREGRVVVYGIPKCQSRYEAIEQIEWETLTIDPIGGKDESGDGAEAWAKPTLSGDDSRRRVWCRLRDPGS